MSEIDDMLAARASQSHQQTAQDASSIEALLNQRAGGASVADTKPSAPAKPSTGWERFKSGLADVPVGITQLATHLMPEPTVSAEERAASGVGPNEPLESFDTVVADREKAYQAGRAAAGSTGFDWARTAGNVANPINYAVPGSGATGALGRIAGAGLQGSAVASLNPVTEPGNFWGGKLWQAGVGGAMGTLVGGAAEALSKPFTWAARGVRNMLGGSTQQADAAAQGVIDQTLAAGGMKTTDLPPEMVDGVRDQIRNAMETGGDVDAASLRAQAEAASLPIPIKLSVAQASGDPAKYATEQELAKVQGQGPNPLLQLFGENNQKLIDNLGKLGAEGAPTTREAGTQGLITLAKMDQKLDQAKNAAYNVVRDSQGRSATLDAEHFYMNAQAALERDNVTSFVPKENIAKMFDDYTEGRMPLTVDTMTSFDKVLSRAQRTLTNGNEVHAVGLIRSALHDTPVSSAEGDQAVQAYNHARSLARQQFQLADPTSQSFIPGYASMLKGMGKDDQGKFISALEGGTANLDPEKWFGENLVKATPAGAKKLMSFLNQGGDEAQPTIQALQHGIMGDIRDSVVKGNDEVGRSVFSNAAMGKIMNRDATLRAILPGDTVDALGRLYNTSSRISGIPYKSAVNWSNTAAASANMAALKEGAGTVGRIVAPRGAAALDVATDIGKRRAARAAAQAATQPVYATPGANRAARAAASGAVSLSALLSGRDQSEQ